MNKLNFSLCLLGLTLVGYESAVANAHSIQLHSDFSSINRSNNQTELTWCELPKILVQAQTSEPIQTQPGPKEMQVELLSARVTDRVLTVTIRYITQDVSFINTNYPIEEVSFIEDDTAKQHSVLQDSPGKYLASPKYASGSKELINLSLNSNSKAEIAWFKFPAPSPDAKTISINIPEVVPFDGVTIQR